MMARVVHVESCSGPTGNARLARDVADRLRRRLDLQVLGVDTIVVDGCGSACASRRLEVQRIPAARIQLDELGVAGTAGHVDVEQLAGRALDRLRASASGSSRRLARPAPPPARGKEPHRAHTSGDYLLALSMLTAPVVSCGVRATDLPTLASHVARSLGVTRASAGEMVRRLQSMGLVEHGPRKEILLTEAGHTAAADIVRRHRIVERLLTDSLGYTAAEAYGVALQVRDGFPDELVERIAARLTPPARCPHGWPIDVSIEQAEAESLLSLASFGPGTATVVALLESDTETLAGLAVLGIEPGTELRVVDTASDPITVEVESRRRTLDRAAGATVFVRRARPSGRPAR